jgi:hypothetical protein
VTRNCCHDVRFTPQADDRLYDVELAVVDRSGHIQGAKVVRRVQVGEVAPSSPPEPIVEQND